MPSKSSGFLRKRSPLSSLPFIGSRALVGRVDSDLLAIKDADGISLAQALTSFGLAR